MYGTKGFRALLNRRLGAQGRGESRHSRERHSKTAHTSNLTLNLP